MLSMTSQQLVVFPSRSVHVSFSVYSLNTFSQPGQCVIGALSAAGSTPMHRCPSPTAPIAIDGDTTFVMPLGCAPCVMLLIVHCQCCAALGLPGLPVDGSKRPAHPELVAGLHWPGAQPHFVIFQPGSPTQYGPNW